MNKIKIKLTFLKGEFTEKEISDYLHLESDHSKYPEIIWIKSWDFSPDEKYIEKELSEILNILVEKKNQINEISNEAELSLSGSFKSSGSIGIHIDTTTIQKMSELNIPFDIDIYDLSEKS
jgi:hypothetical protein